MTDNQSKVKYGETRMLLLDVPYNEKDEAKALGARWDPKLKKWYVQNERNYYKFTKWIGLKSIKWTPKVRLYATPSA